MKIGREHLSLLVILIVIAFLLFMLPNSQPATQRVTPSPLPPATLTQTLTLSAPGTPRASVTPLASATPSQTPAPTQARAILQIGVYYPNPDAENILLYQSGTLDYFDIPVLITINNLGTAGSNEGAAFSINYQANNQSYPAKFRLDKLSPYVATTPIHSVAPGQVVTFTISVMVPRTYAGTDVSLSVQVDSCQKSVECQYQNPSIKLPTIVYDFISNAHLVRWTGFDPNHTKPWEYIINLNGAVNAHGFVLLASRKTMEDGSHPDYILYTHPAWVSNGAVWGAYDLHKIRFQPGDLLVARVGMIQGASGDGVTFSLRCTQKPPRDSPGFDLINLYHAPDGILKDLVIPLPEDVINGKCSQFYLAVEAGPTSDTDWAAWVAAYIARP
ncbi:MAG: hypothetical protein HY258_11550 [Chloroflexi bacterium]|nr:hypothetical protein [Chloroflexota bacterium]